MLFEPLEPSGVHQNRAELGIGAAKKMIGPVGLKKAPRGETLSPPLALKLRPRLSALEDVDDFPETLPLLLELQDPLDSGKDLLAVQTVAGLCTLSFCNQTEGRIVMDGLTREAGVPHHLTDLVELLWYHRVSFRRGSWF